MDDHTGTYDTLSYCWGLGAANRDVIIRLPGANGKDAQRRRLRISASLEEALLSISRQSEAKIARPIFADQICINQADKNEKIQQVQLMGQIYSRSARTIVWLGPQSPETRRYYDFSEELNREAVLGRVMGPNKSHVVQVLDAVVDPNIRLETAAEKEDRDDILDLVTRYGPRLPMRGMAEILRRAWMGRLWTVQEGCLPPEVTFRCGDLSLCFDCFRGAQLFYSVCTRYWARYLATSVSRDEMQAREKMFELTKPLQRLIVERRAIHNNNPTTKQSSLFDIVLRYNVNNATPKLGATKAEDRIYSLLGLAAADEEVTRETVEGMEVDNVRGTYTKFAASVMKRNVDVLLFVQARKTSEEVQPLPSWVPDWSTDPLQTPYGYTNPTTPLFSAGGQHSFDNVSVDVSTGTLRVGAIAVGRVTKLGMSRIKSDLTSVSGNLDYISARRYFEELEEFVRRAALVVNTTTNPSNINHTPSPLQEGESDDQALTLEATMTRISDGGLSTKEFPKEYDPSTALAKLRDIHKKVSLYGGNLLRIENNTRSMSSFTGMIRSVGIMPWHWTPASEIDVVRLCAVDPIAAARTWITGTFLTVTDVLQVLWYSTKVRLYAAWIRARRMRSKINLQGTVGHNVLWRFGISADDVQTPEWNHYTDNLLRNMGRRLFLTDTGYVGLGPEHMEAGDTIVVILGGSVAHALRPRKSSYSVGTDDDGPVSSSWSYVGEVYCDGVMDGELVAQQTREVTRYKIL